MFLTVHDMIRLYENVRSTSWCYQTYALIKAAYAMDKPKQILTVRQFVDYMNLDINEVYQRLGYMLNEQTSN